MKAVVSTGYGGPEILQLQTVSIPVPGDDDVLVQIKAASITTAETMMRTGYPLIGRLFTGIRKPKNRISGTGFAGVVVAVGDKVTNFDVGDRVFGESLDTFGTYAQYICVASGGIVDHIPENISYEEAAVVGDGPVTSLNFLKNLCKLQPQSSVLIIGASGSLGTAAIQLAKYYGAIVTGVCSDKNTALVKSLGADKVINYEVEDFTQNGLTYDIIYDTVGKSSYAACKDSLSHDGIYMSPVLSLGLLFQMLWTSFASNKKAKFAATGMLPHHTIQMYLQEIGSLMAVGKLKNIVSRRFAIGEIPDAHREIERGHKIGNFVVDFEL